MILTKDPWVTLIFNEEIHGAISRALNDATYLLLVGSKRPGVRPDYYSPLGLESMPSKDDESAFAKVFHVFDGLVSEGVLKGPGGEDHPATFRRFDYASTLLSPAEVLRRLETFGVSVHVCSFQYQFPIECFRTEREAKLAEAERILRDEYGPWMDESTEVKLPEVVIVPTEEEKAEQTRAACERVEQLMRELNRPSLLRRGWTKFRNWLCY